MPQPSAPLSQGNYLAVGNGHRLYFSGHGNASGPASVVLHGGPGSGCTPAMLDWFDLSTQRVILLDQRGAGKSLPSGETAHNTTTALLADLEALRESLQIARWSVVGGSWGSALGIAYAGTHPQSVSSLVLRGIFLASQREMKWFFQDLVALVPEAWQALTRGWTSRQKANVLQYLTAVFQNGTPPEIQMAAQRWQEYEDAIMQAMTGTAAMPKPANPDHLDHAVAKYRLQAHYLSQNCFLSERTIFRLARASFDVPTVIVHGTHDWICPPENVLRLKRFMPHADVQWVNTGTHTVSDPLILAALRSAIRSVWQYG
ncbi:MAG: alpha/beta fold hydrolase [Pseudomonas sp.]